jgi:hypothetical protein
VRILDPAYEATLIEKAREATFQVEVYSGAAWRDITDDVKNIRLTQPEEARPAEARLEVENPEGKYDPTRTYAVTWPAAVAQYLARRNPIRIHLGGRAGGVDYLYDAFTGIIATGGGDYQRGEAETVALQAFDNSLRWGKQDITSPVYEAWDANDILKDLFVRYAGLADPGDFNLAAINYQIRRIQFVEETLMDAGRLLMQVGDHRLFCDYDGRLRSAAPSASKPAYDYAYTGEWVERVGLEWQLPQVNTVVVLGRELEPVLTLGAQVAFATIAMWLYGEGRKTAVVVKFPEGERYINCQPDLPPFRMMYADRDVLWERVYEDEKEVKFQFWCAGAGNSVVMNIVADTAAYVVPQVSGFAQDAAGYAADGRLPLEITNPCLQFDADCQWLADTLLARQAWYETQIKLRVPMNLKHELGDTIMLSNPRTGDDLWLYVRAISHGVKRGTASYTELDCLMEQ